MLTSVRLLGSSVALLPTMPEDAREMLSNLEPENTKNLKFFVKPPSLQSQSDYLKRMCLSPSDMLWTITRDNQIRGTIGLHEIDHELKIARLGLLIFRTADRGRGYGNEATALILRYAFEHLELNKVFVNVFAENTIGQAHWRKLGFTVEGRLREEYLLNGTYHDLIRLTLLAREWAALNRKE